jgi:hypothetical protein
MVSETHWLEIDLLRAGERPPEVRGAGDYYAACKRVDSPDLEVWPISLRDPLPTIAVPLTPPHDDVALDLQAVLDLLFERCRYAELLDYRAAPPPPPFTLDDARWVAEPVERWLAARAAQRSACQRSRSRSLRCGTTRRRKVSSSPSGVRSEVSIVSLRSIQAARYSASNCRLISSTSAAPTIG